VLERALPVTALHYVPSPLKDGILDVPIFEKVSLEAHIHTIICLDMYKWAIRPSPGEAYLFVPDRACIKRARTVSQNHALDLALGLWGLYTPIIMSLDLICPIADLSFFIFFIFLLNSYNN
jgi:hypothetical protein